MLARIHINQHVIRANRKTGARDPVITVKRGGKNIYGHTVELLGPGKVIYSPDKPLSCGAHVWIETTSPVKIDGTTYSDVRGSRSRGNVKCEVPSSYEAPISRRGRGAK